MAKDGPAIVRQDEQLSEDDDNENRSLLSSQSADEAIDNLVHDGGPLSHREDIEAKGPPIPNRVRFQIDDAHPNGNAQTPDSAWVDEEDYLAHNSAGGRRDSTGHRAPLLTDIEAPSVTVASADIGFNAEDLLESARPKSDMRSAFMNMANNHNSLLIYGSLRKPTMDRFARVTHYSTGISMVACMIMALVGFLTFGDKTKGNVLNNFPNDNIMVNIARFCFGLNMLTTLPLEAFVCREVMTHYYFPDEPWNPNRHLIFSTSLVVSSMVLSLLTCDLGAVFELIGATSACALAYILPPLCYIKLSTRSWKTVPAVLCVAFGVCVMGISLIQAVAKIIRNEGGAQTC
ncbi:MAG: hypothetical protein M1832_000045 [Thelocarpon impressellum]|nr:MAG: hypothetical protein M1832_000045 [Thelocarpon impressellum]